MCCEKSLVCIVLDVHSLGREDGMTLSESLEDSSQPAEVFVNTGEAGKSSPER
jgi:hypothetical protein